jgi:cysteinyl-tRNA synthetase
MYVCGPTVASNVHLGNVSILCPLMLFSIFTSLEYKSAFVTLLMWPCVDDVDEGDSAKKTFRAT